MMERIEDDIEGVDTDKDPQIALWEVQACMRLSSIALLRGMSLGKFFQHPEILEVRRELTSKIGSRADEVMQEWMNNNLSLFSS